MVSVAVEATIDDFVLPDGKIIKYWTNGLYLAGFETVSGQLLDYTMFRSYEEVESKIRYLKCKPDDVFLDVGAAIGSWSIYAAMYGAKVYAFEPGHIQKNVLDVNARVNDVRDKIEVYDLALRGPEDAQMVFDSFMKTFKKPDNIIDPGHRLRDVNSMSLDQWVEQTRSQLPHIDYIKIDVEGMEFEVLKGAYYTLREFKPKLIVEIHENDDPILRHDIEKLLIEDLGYKHERVPGLNDYFYH